MKYYLTFGARRYRLPLWTLRTLLRLAMLFLPGRTWNVLAVVPSESDDA